MAAAKVNVRVPLGRTLATPGVLEVTTPTERNIAFSRHAHGDWGDVTGEDWRSNDRALQTGERLTSVLPHAGRHKILDHHGGGQVGYHDPAAA